MSDTVINRLVDVEKQVEATQQCMIDGDKHIKEMHRLAPHRECSGNTGYAAFDNLRRLVGDLRIMIEKERGSSVTS